MWVREGECHQCGECCKTVNVTVVRDITLRQHGTIEELERYLKYRGIQLVGEDVDNNYLFYAIPIPCDQLTADNRCQVHATPDKPLLCLKYPSQPDDIEQCGYTFRRATVLDRVGS
ncbi:YkgJ family cysteine cluster protein [Nitrospina watsonii]|uniref:YkgJ family cysteine cluster protein n=1 Tax=Nitrospina watsonii TaxID=1323948 RepID=A0ABM9HC75_9BACT|nr:YkgJ family cysteine cluster protein [Nitrospina watsonii]CAI2717682.1 conserved protein of unknown function [Nitrospina watsonii]